MDDRLTRRRFLKKALRNAGGAAVGLSILPLAACEMNSFEPTASGTQIPFLTPLAPPDPNDRFYEQYGANGTVVDWPGIQSLSQADWRLRIDGLVGTPLTLTYEDVMAEAGQAVSTLHTMRCIKDESFVPGLIGTTVWTGIPLRIFLERAGIDRARARRLRFYGTDGFTNNLALDQVYDVPLGLVAP
jgi:DMSO/TMAO reductase YedYZ molybdopterin-dependent catalytic subunit